MDRSTSAVREEGFEVDLWAMEEGGPDDSDFAIAESDISRSRCAGGHTLR